jgi:hypothetical protein
MADKKKPTATTTPEEDAGRRAQLTRIAAWTDTQPKPKRVPEEREDQAEAS